MTFIEEAEGIRNLNPGDHVCFFYETEQEHAAGLKPFLRRAWEQGNQVAYVTHSHSPETIQSYLRDDDCEVETYMQAGGLRFLKVEETYLKGSTFSPDRMLNSLASMSRTAISGGYSGLQVTGEMSWILQKPPGAERVVEYEAKVTELTRRIECAALCQYDMRLFPATLLLYMLATHPTVIVGTILLENPYYMVPPPFMGQEPATEILNGWLNNLYRGTNLQ